MTFTGKFDLVSSGAQAKAGEVMQGGQPGCRFEQGEEIDLCTRLLVPQAEAARRVDIVKAPPQFSQADPLELLLRAAVQKQLVMKTSRHVG